MNKNPILFLFLYLFFFHIGDVAKAQQDTSQFSKLIGLSLDDLLKVKIVTASKRSEKISDVPASVIIITRSEIENYGYTSIEEILSNIPGLYPIDNYYWLGGVGFGVRGFFSDGHFKEMIILVNGVNQSDGIADAFQLGKLNVPVEAIDKIEVVRGPIATIYGNGAFFGAINIITNQTDEPVSQISTQYGSLNTYKTTLRVSGKENKMDYTINAGLYGTKGLDLKWKDMVTDQSIITRPIEQGGWGLSSAEAGSKGQLEDNRKYFNFSGGYKNFSCDLTFSNSKKGVVDGFPGAGKGILQDQTFASAHLQYKKDFFSEKISILAHFTYFEFDHYSDYNYFVANNYGLNIFKSNHYETEVDLFIHPSQKIDITTGIYRRTVTNLKILLDLPVFQLSHYYWYLPKGENVSTNAFFAQIDIKPFQRLKLTAGSRMENLGKYDYVVTGGNTTYPLDSLTINRKETFGSNKIYFNYRAAAIYSINEKNILKLMYGTAVKQPSLGDNTDKIFEPTEKLIFLEPSVIKTTELNYCSTLSPKMFVSISVFNNKLDKLLVRDNLFENGQYVLVTRNAGKQETNGAEFNFKYKPIEKISIDLAISYQNSKSAIDSLKKIPLSYAPKILGYGKASYRFIKYNIILSLSGRYVDQMESGLKPGSAVRIGAKAKEYFVFDFNLRWDKIYKGFCINFSIKNILNKEIRYPTTRNSAWADRGTIGYPRMFLFNVGYKF